MDTNKTASQAVQELGRAVLENSTNCIPYEYADRAPSEYALDGQLTDINRLSPIIDHTFLRIDETTNAEDLLRVAEETVKYGFRALIIHPNVVATVRRHFPSIRIGTVISYPLGCDTIETKEFAIKDAAERGANEVDVVVDLFALRAANFRKVAHEARKLVEVAHSDSLLIKLIIETPILNEEQVHAVVRALLPAKADFWKTSTGYGRRPTQLSHIRMLANLVPEGVLIKASGGIRTLADVKLAIDEGAAVIGTSSGVSIVEELNRQQ